MPKITDAAYGDLSAYTPNFTLIGHDPTEGNAADQTKRLTLENLLTFLAPTPGGRLTLTSSTPVTTSDVIGATSVYYTPFVNNLIALWDGASWTLNQFTEKTLALGTVTSGLPYDVFGYLSAGVLALEKLAWTNGTTRATDITLQDNRYCKSGDKTRLYLGTLYTTSTTTTEDSGGGTTTQVGGKRFLWNMYNRVRRTLSVIDTTATWSYTTDTTRQTNGAAGNKVEFILGLSQDPIEASVRTSVKLASNTTRGAKSGVGLDTITAFNGIASQVFNTNASDIYFQVGGELRSTPALGYHYISWNERGASIGTCVFDGANAAGIQTGLVASILG